MRRQVIALVDTCNFYVSVERVFHAFLGNKAMVVLSNSDGNIVAASTEARVLELKRGLQYFGMTKIHATRSTFALTMLKSGATLLDIMHRLGHNNIATTSCYLNSLVSAENASASKLIDDMGIKDNEEFA